MDVPSDNLALFSHEAALIVLHEYLGFLGEVNLSNTIDAGHGAESVVPFKRLNAFIETMVSCFRVDGSDKVWGHKQKLYSDTFLSCLFGV